MTCTKCGSGNLLDFDWKSLQNSPREINIRDGILFLEKSFFKKSSDLQRGSFYECTECSQNWYLDDKGETMHFISEEKFPLIKRWSQSPQFLTNETIKIARKIKYTPNYSHTDTRKILPCSVTIKNGDIFQKSLLIQQHNPPYDWTGKCFLASDIEKIEPSPYALPFVIRRATSQAEESRMGSAHTKLITPKGTQIILNYLQHFYDGDECKADELLLWSENYYPNLKVHYEPKMETVYFIADLSE